MRTSAVAATVPSARSSRARWSSSPSLNQWAPLRGTVLELRTMPLPWGGTGLLPIRTPPGASLAIQYALCAGDPGLWILRRPRDLEARSGRRDPRRHRRGGDHDRSRARDPRRLRQGPGAVPGRLAARDQRALRGFLPRAGVLGARRAGGRHREAVRGGLRARPDRQGAARARRTVSQGQPRAVPRPRVDGRGARRPGGCATSRTRTTSGPTRWSSSACATSRPTPSRSVCCERTASPCGCSSPCRPSAMTTVGPSASSLRCTM